MYTDREEFEGWMERIMERFDRTEKLLERVLKKNNTLDGEEVLDNQDLCLLLKVGIRTLQRYRAIGVLPYFTISGKVFYRTKDVHEFIRTRFAELPDREIRRGYCFVIREVSVSLRCEGRMRLGIVKLENLVFICRCSRLSLSLLHKDRGRCFRARSLS